MSKEFHYILSLLFVFLLVSCDKEEDLVVLNKQKVIVIFSTNGLGDMSYNDQILRGLQSVRQERGDLEMLFYSPQSEEEVESIFTEWLETPAGETPELFVLASSDYEGLAERCLTDTDADMQNKDILLFESNNTQNLPIHHFRISMYGASYLAGITAARCTAMPALVVLGNGNDKPIGYAADGFKDGYRTATGQEAQVTALADDWTGFAAAGKAYRNMTEWGKTYGFIFPVAGGSNIGIYRYIRELPEGLFTAGMDVDQSSLCSKITGSVVKHIDLLISDYITQWLDKHTLPEQTLYGLESGYVDWALSDNYYDTLHTLVEQYRNEAITKENEYDENL